MDLSTPKLIQVAWYHQNLFYKIISFLWIIPISLYQGFTSTLVVVVGAHFVGTPFVVFAARALNRRVIFRSTLLGDDDPKTLALDKSIRGNYRRFVLEHCHGFLAINQSFANQYQEFYGDKKPIIKVTQGIDTSRFNSKVRFTTSNTDTAHLNIISVGFLIGRKGYIDIFNVLSKLTIPFNYVVVSNNIFPKAVTLNEDLDRIVSCGNEMLKGRITFFESVENVEELYGKADVLLHNSSKEGMPNVVMESMACGVIPVVRELPGFRDYLVEDRCNGFLFSEIEEVNPFLEYLYSNYKEKIKLSEAASKYALDNFSFEKTWQEIRKPWGYA